MKVSDNVSDFFAVEATNSLHRSRRRNGLTAFVSLHSSKCCDNICAAANALTTFVCNICISTTHVTERKEEFPHFVYTIKHQTMASIKGVFVNLLPWIIMPTIAGLFWPIILLAHYSQTFAGYYYAGMILSFGVIIDKELREKLFAPLSSLPQGLKILEVGPAKDGNLSYMPNGSIVTTLELNPLLQRQQQVIQKKHPDLTIDKMLVGNIEDARKVLPQDNSFDVIIMTHVLCCVKNKDAAVREMYRLLKRGGKLFFLDIVQYDKKTHPVSHFIQSLFMPLHRFMSLGCRGGSYDAASLLSKHGFDVTNMKYTIEETHPLPYACTVVGFAIKN